MMELNKKSSNSAMNSYHTGQDKIGFATEKDELKMSYNLEMLKRLSEYEKKYYESVKKYVFKKCEENSGLGFSILELRNKRTILKAEIEKYKRTLFKKRQKIEKAKRMIEFAQKRNFEKSQELLREREKQSNQPTRLGESRMILAQNKIIYENTKDLIEKKTMELLSELQFVFTISKDFEKNRWTIVGLSPDLQCNQTEGHLFYETSAALGHVSTLVYYLAKYLDVQLLYPVRPRSSESLIYSEVANTVYSTYVFPLYPMKHAKRLKYQYAVKLLQSDICHLLSSQKLQTIDQTSMLKNLSDLLLSLDL